MNGYVGLGTVQFVPDEFFYSRNLEGILLARKTDGGAGCAGPSCAADPVHIIFRIIGKCIVYDMADSLHMKATSGDIRGDEHTDIARAEIFRPVRLLDKQ